MHGFGLLLVTLSLLSVIYGLLQRRKANKIASAAHHKTGELASNPALGQNPKRLFSAEGSAQPQQPFIAPCSGQPCAYYEVRVDRVWEKMVKSESGYKTERGTTNIETERKGTTFLLNDGSGPVVIDARERVSAPMKESFGQTQNVSSGDVVVGQFRTHVARHHGDETVTGIKVTEQIFAPTGQLFAIGKLADGTLTKTDGLLGGLEILAGTRDAILGKTAKHAKMGLIAAAAMFVPGMLFTLLFHAAPSAPDHSCQASGITDVTVEACDDRLYNDEGKTYSWKVTKPGTFAVDVTPPVGAKITIDPEVTVKDGAGTVVFSGGKGVKHQLAVGTYTLNVKDENKGRAATMSEGFGFTLKITETAGAAPPAASAPPAAPTPSAAPVPVAANTKPAEHAPDHAASKPAADKPEHKKH
jgi:hypothetical protein